jgi:hypothetical protein
MASAEGHSGETASSSPTQSNCPSQRNTKRARFRHRARTNTSDQRGRLGERVCSQAFALGVKCVVDQRVVPSGSTKYRTGNNGDARSWSVAGINGNRYGSALERLLSTMTGSGRFLRFCSYSSFLSMLRNTSNAALAAAASRAPFSSSSQVISLVVLTMWPTRCFRNRRGML